MMTRISMTLKGSPCWDPTVRTLTMEQCLLGIATKMGGGANAHNVILMCTGGKDDRIHSSIPFH